MAKKRDTGRKETKRQEKKALSRRDFFTRGAAAGVGVAALSGSGEAHAQGIRWDYEADVARYHSEPVIEIWELLA